MEQPEDAASVRHGTAYDIHRVFCVHVESHHKEVLVVVGAIATEVNGLLRVKTERTKLERHVRKIVLDLYISAMNNPTGWIDYPRRKQKYAKGTMMHRVHMKHHPTVAIVDALHALGYIEHLDGKHALGLQSSMRATSLLMEVIHSGQVEPRMVHLEHDPIYLKDRDGAYIDISESRRVTRMANRVVSLNKLLLSSDITFHLSEPQRRQYIAEAKRVPEMHRRTMYRVFNRGLFQFGGRFYGHAVQGIKSWWRQFVRINGEPVRELDYGGMHIRLLYAQAGAVPPPGDVYDLGVSEHEAARFARTWGVSLRSTLKQLLLVGINARSEKAAVWATWAELREGRDEKAPEEREFRGVLKGLLGQIKRRHPAIGQFICTDQGIRLQRKDSDIADDILAEFVRQRRPIVPIHDSFLVQEQDRDLLWETMERAWVRHVPGVEPVIEDKVTKWRVVSKFEDSCGFRDETGSHMERVGDPSLVGLVA